MALLPDAFVIGLALLTFLGGAAALAAQAFKAVRRRGRGGALGGFGPNDGAMP